jgi:hypothetical protein
MGLRRRGMSKPKMGTLRQSDTVGFGMELGCLHRLVTYEFTYSPSEFGDLHFRQILHVTGISINSVPGTQNDGSQISL